MGIGLAVVNLWTVVGVMAVCGVAGGVVNLLTLVDGGGSDGRGVPATRAMVWRCLASGLVAAFMVPLFLRMISSDLFAEAQAGERGYEALLVLAGFCLIAGVSSRAFIQTLSDRVLREAKEAKEEARSARESAGVAEGKAEAADRKADAAEGKAEAVDRKADALALSPVPLPQLLRALGEREVAVGPDGVGLSSSSSSSALEVLRDVWEEDPEDLPGGVAERDGRRLSATVGSLTSAGTVAAVQLQVRSTDPARPLRGPVVFRLHPTFTPSEVRVEPGADGVARLDLSALEAFTAAALTDEGATRLQLNLNGVPGGPPGFYYKESSSD